MNDDQRYWNGERPDETARRARHGIRDAALTVAGAVIDLVALAAMLALAWLFLAITPDQPSAEADWCAAQMEEAAR